MTLLVNANALRIPLPDESVHCVVTSPPYWSLRSYSGQQIFTWGGREGCEHLWGEEKIKTARPDRDHDGSMGFAETRGTEGHRAAKALTVSSGQYCSLCNAWRGALGLEPTPEQYVVNMVAVFREAWRVLRGDGTCWVNLGSSYAGAGYSNHANTGGAQRSDGGKQHHTRAGGFKPKDLIPIPWMVAMALQADGWYLRSDIIWHKPNPMPESVTDRPTKSHEYLFLLTKRKSYYYDCDAVREPTIPDPRDALWRKTKVTSRHDHKHDAEQGMMQTRTQSNGFVRMSNPAGRNRRTVWTIATAPYSGAHFATFPPALVEPCVKAGTSEWGVCGACGSPWKRETQSEFIPQQDIKDPAKLVRDPAALDPSSSWGGSQRGNSRVTTTGWRPTCKCEAGEPVPAVVLDIFCGSGTTLLVARRLGRHSIGLDLSYPYLMDQARTRLELDKLAEWGSGRRAESNLDGLPMFNGEAP